MRASSAVQTQVAGICRLLKTEVLEHVHQAIELAKSLNDPAVFDALLEGIVVTQRPSDHWILTVFELPARMRGVRYDRPIHDYVALSLAMAANTDAGENLLKQVRGMTWLHPDMPLNLSRLTALEYLSTEGSMAGHVPALKKLKNLHIRLDLSFPPPTGSESLERMVIEQCPEVNFAPNAFPSLKSVEIRGSRLKNFQWTHAMPALEALRIAYAGGIQSLEGLETLPLRVLSAPLFHVTSLEPLRHMTSLRVLNVSAASIEDLSPLAGLSSLQSLDLSNSRVTTLGPLAALRSLESLTLQGADRLKSLEGIPPQLWQAKGDPRETLALDRAMGLETLQGLESPLQGHHSLNLQELPALRSLQGIGRPLKLKLVQLGTLPSLVNLEGIEGCENLEDLWITRLSHFNDLSALHALSSLRRINLHDLPLLEDLSALASHPNLEVVVVERCPRVTDLSALASLSKLRVVRLHQTGVVKGDAPRSIRRQCTWAIYVALERLQLSAPQTEVTH